MQIHLKRGEKIYLNGAVVRVDRRTSLEFLNDVDFLLENHVIQAEEANTPLKQLYFVVQTMLIDPANSGITLELFKHLLCRTSDALDSRELLTALEGASRKVSEGRYFDALRLLRGAFGLEKQLMEARGANEGMAS
ncbi:MAG: flagellar biosynthesis repressor FlbT [Alphaproteobacteria bacterium]|nr:flagellar biosynthesis repressor FlbT [Alphaproteobacteria bacterium]